MLTEKKRSQGKALQENLFIIHGKQIERGSPL